MIYKKLVKPIKIKAAMVDGGQTNDSDIFAKLNGGNIFNGDQSINSGNLLINSGCVLAATAPNTWIGWGLSPAIPNMIAFRYENTIRDKQSIVIEVENNNINEVYDNSVATKKYVDSEVAKVSGNIDLSNVAVLTRLNTFTEENIFQNSTRFKSEITFDGGGSEKPTFSTTAYIESGQQAKAQLILENNSGSGTKEYEPIVPTSITTKKYVDNQIAQAKPQDYDTIKQQVQTNTNTLPTKLDTTTFDTYKQETTTKINGIETIANTNQSDIANINRSIEALNQNQANDISYVGELNSKNTYKINDCGYNGDYWFIAIKDNVNGDTSVKENWKQVVAPQAGVDLSNYYNKVQTNQLLQPLENRLVSIETKNNQQDSAINEINTTIGEVKEKFNGYYTKQEADNLLSPINNRVEQAHTNIGRNYEQIVALQSENRTQQSEIDNLKNKPSIDTSNFAKLDTLNKFTKNIYVDYKNDHEYLYLSERVIRNNDSGISLDIGSPLLLYNRNPTDFIEKIYDWPEIIINKGFLDKKLKEKQDKLIAGNGIDINNNVISLNASLNTPDMSQYYTIEQWDKMYQGMEMTGPTPIITDFGRKALLVFQVSTDNIKLADFIGNMPSEIANWRNIANIESATVNAINADSDILTKQLDLLISHYNGRLFVKSYNNLPGDVKYIRFRIWVNKK